MVQCSAWPSCELCTASRINSLRALGVGVGAPPAAQYFAEANPALKNAVLPRGAVGGKW